MPRPKSRIAAAVLLAFIAILPVFPLANRLQAEQPTAEDWQQLTGQIEPLYQILLGNDHEFAITLEATLPIDGKPQAIQGELRRFDDESFDLVLTHPEYAVSLRRRSGQTALALPKHGVVFLANGDVPEGDHLQPLGSAKRLISSGTQVSEYLGLLAAGDAASSLRLLRALVKFEFQASESQWLIDGQVKLKATRDGQTTQLAAQGKDFKVTLSVSEPGSASAADDWPDYRVETLPREELERTLARGLRRALEVLAPSPELTAPRQVPRQVPHGELRYVDGQRLVVLAGTPEQIGRAHGELLPVESQRCVDSVLYAFGTVQTIVNGRWFRSDLEEAFARLRPHIPHDHVSEMHAMAAALGMEPSLAEVVNVFPELFHCSGFAVFGSATVDGKLYHGRVLDYMTTIGLQDSATTFVVAVDGKIPFANIGYAGFTGSVSGMNSAGISLGEMGGRGEGQWDGVPMATLMRRALEECDSLAEVMQLWTDSPRTCEYYYVFADGKTNEAVGVAATPDKIEFVLPGEGHELLGAGIPDSVVLSAGSRLETLRQRVMDWHGKIDAQLGQQLMSRPVAMKSNLHNVLFVPADGVFYVANADHQRPAAERPYVRYDLRQLLDLPRGVASTIDAQSTPER